jgi:hypothetical protein
MSYKFPDVIEDIQADLSHTTDNVKQELQQINTRQQEIKANLSALKPRLLRAQNLKSRNDLICAYCFIMHDIEFPLTPIEGEARVDRFRCRECDTEYEVRV